MAPDKHIAEVSLTQIDAPADSPTCHELLGPDELDQFPSIQCFIFKMSNLEFPSGKNNPNISPDMLLQVANLRVLLISRLMLTHQIIDLIQPSLMS